MTHPSPAFLEGLRGHPRRNRFCLSPPRNLAPPSVPYRYLPVRTQMLVPYCTVPYRTAPYPDAVTGATSATATVRWRTGGAMSATATACGRGTGEPPRFWRRSLCFPTSAARAPMLGCDDPRYEHRTNTSTIRYGRYGSFTVYCTVRYDFG